MIDVFRAPLGRAKRGSGIVFVTTSALLLGWLVAIRPVFAVVALVAAVVLAIALASRFTPIGITVAFVLGGHLTIGPFLILGLLPRSAALALDIATLGALILALFERSPRRSRVLGIVVSFVAVLSLGAVNPALPSLEYGVLGLRLMILPLLVLIVIVIANLSDADRGLLFVVAGLGWLFNIVLALKQWLIGFSGAELAWIADTRSTYLVGDQIRLIGASQSNQDFALLAAITFPFIATVAFAHGRSARWRMGFGVLAVLSLMVLLGSLVRSALIGAMCGALAALIIQATDARSRRRQVGLALALSALLLVASSLVWAALPADKAATLKERVSSLLSPEEDFALRERQVKAWPRAVSEIAAHPLGAGAGSAGPLSQRRDDAPLGPLVPDNGYLLVGVQFGIPGLLLFVVMLIRIASVLGEAARRKILLGAAAFGSLIALGVAMLAGNYISLPAPTSVLAVALAFGLRAANEGDAPSG